MKDFNYLEYQKLVDLMKKHIDIFHSLKIIWEDKDVLKRISSGIDKITKDFEKFKYDKYFIEYIISEINNLKLKQDGYNKKN
jgi:hypothetical protein